MLHSSHQSGGGTDSMGTLLSFLPRGNTLDDAEWQRRHRLLKWLLGLHLAGLALLALVLGRDMQNVLLTLAAPAICLAFGHLLPQRRPASFFVTAGLTGCSVILVSITHGSIEAHFHFFIIIGFIALYQDWVPFLWNIVFTVFSHGIGSVLNTHMIFNHMAGQTSPWLWSVIHGVAVLAACVGMVLFWRVTEDEQRQREALAKQLADAELSQRLSDAEHDRRRFTSELLVNLARRNQGMLYRQLDIINQLEEKEQDPDALAELFRLDHLATRVRRNAESLLVLSDDQPARVWSGPVAMHEIVQAAIAETEHLDRVVFNVDEQLAVVGHAVADLTHLLAELIENAVRFSPPEANVTIRTRPYLRAAGAQLLTIEDWGVGMPPADLAAANELLRHRGELEVSVERLGFHVVSRLARRHDIEVSLTPTPGCGITAVVMLPARLFAQQRSVTAAAHLAELDVPRQGSAPVSEQVPVEPSRRRRPDTPAEVVPVTAAATKVGQPTTPQIEPQPRLDAPIQDSSPASEEPAALPAWPGPQAWWGTSSAEATTNAPPPNKDDPALVVPAAEPSLQRRVPQTHLAPELSQQRTEPAELQPPPAYAARAANALSRFQTSRQTAQSEVAQVGFDTRLKVQRKGQHRAPGKGGQP
jgi:signal transduction histidine kinase